MDCGIFYPDPRDVDLSDYTTLVSNLYPVGAAGHHPWKHVNFDDGDDADLNAYNLRAANFFPASYGTMAVLKPLVFYLLVIELPLPVGVRFEFSRTVAFDISCFASFVSTSDKVKCYDLWELDRLLVKYKEGSPLG